MIKDDIIEQRIVFELITNPKDSNSKAPKRKHTKLQKNATAIF